MTNYLIDTDILIDNLRGYRPARALLKRFEAGEEGGSLSIITVTEIAAGQMGEGDEELRVKSLLSIFEIIPVDFPIAWRAGEIKRKYGARIADAVIAATAMQRDLTLLTRNLRHFELIEWLNVEKPYE